MVDVDMPVITDDFTDVVAYGAEHSSVATFLAAAAADMGAKVSQIRRLKRRSLFAPTIKHSARRVCRQ